MVYFGLHIPRLNHFGNPLVDFWLKFTIFKLIFYSLQSLQVFPVGEDIVKLIKLFVSILETPLYRLDCALQNLSISFDCRPDHSKKGKFFSLLAAQKLPVEFNELKEDAFEQCFCLIDGPLLIQKGDESIIDQSCRDVVISEVDQFEQSPNIEHRKNSPFNPKQAFMKFSPLLLRVVSFFFLALIIKNDFLQLLGLQTFHQDVLRLLHYNYFIAIKINKDQFLMGAEYHLSVI